MTDRPLWYDIDGNPITPEHANRLLGNADARRIARDTVGEWRVSTVHIVHDHNFTGTGPPLIFETMVFGPDDAEPPDGVPEQVRTPTKHAALAMHDQVVAELRHALTANTAKPNQQGEQ